MSKKDYELIARVLRGFGGGDAEAITDLLARAFAADNPKFDRARFLRACGIDATEEA